MEPATTIITALGGPTAVSKIVGVHRTRVSNWMRPKDRGGAGGRIPQGHIPTLLAISRERGLGFTAEDFLPRRTDGVAA
jgi:hypothetical protein